MVYLSDKANLRIVAGFVDLLSYAHELDHYYPGMRFVPCVAKKEGGKWKKVAIGKWKENKGYSAAELEGFREMTILSVYLGDQFLVIDQDSRTAIDFVATNFTRSATHVTMSDPETRCSFWFTIPDGELFNTTQNEALQLEIRTGEHYQAIAGLHPTAENYKSVGNPILELTAQQCLEIRAIQGIPSFEDTPEITEEESLGASIADVEYFLELLEIYGAAAAGGGYSAWLQSGMILHWHSQGSPEGLEAWHRWSIHFGWDHEDHQVERVNKWATFTKEKKSKDFVPKTIASLAAVAKGFLRTESLPEKATPEQVVKFQDANRKIEKYCGTIAKDPLLAARQEEYSYQVYDIVNQPDFDLEDCEEAIYRLKQLFSYQEREIRARFEREWEKRQGREAAIKLLSQDNISEPIEVFNLIPYGQDILYSLSLSETPVMSAFLAMICGFASVLPKGERYAVSQDFPTACNFLGMVIGESGTNKSGLFNLLLKGLSVLDKEELTAHNAKVAQYEVEKENWDIENPKGRKKDSSLDGLPEDLRPKEPKSPGEYMERWITPDGSKEGILGHNLLNPDRQFFLWADELGVLVKNVKGYVNQGKNDDPLGNMFIQAFNGSEIKATFATKGKQMGKWGMSMFGGVQPKVLPMMLDLQDFKGSSARLLFTSWGRNRVKHRIATAGNDVHNMAPSAQHVLRIMRGLLELPVKGEQKDRGEEEITRVTDPAFLVWNTAQEKWMSLSFEENNIGYALWLRKLPVQAVKLAGLFHDLRRVGSLLGAYGGDRACYQLTDVSNIDSLSMEAALKVCEYWRQTHKPIFYDAVNISLDAQVMQHLLERLAKYPDGATLETIRNSKYLLNRKMKAPKVLIPLLKALISHGKVIDMGNGMYRLPKPGEAPSFADCETETLASGLDEED